MRAYSHRAARQRERNRTAGGKPRHARLSAWAQAQPLAAGSFTAMTQAVQSDRISRTRLLASVHRIIRVTVELGVMTIP
jgi:hypothetical protein